MATVTAVPGVATVLGHELIAATIDATGYGPLGPQAGL